MESNYLIYWKINSYHDNNTNKLTTYSFINQNNNPIVAIIATSESDHRPMYQISHQLQNSVLWIVHRPNIQFWTIDKDVTTWMSLAIRPYPPSELHLGNKYKFSSMLYYIKYTHLMLSFPRLADQVFPHLLYKIRQPQFRK